MDRVTEIKRLRHQVKSELDDCLAKLLQEAREWADQAVNEDVHLKTDKDKFDALRTEIEDLKSRKAQQTNKMRLVDDEDKGLSHRLEIVRIELLNEGSATEGKKETLKNLKAEVEEMEFEKENRVERMKKGFENTMKLWKIYKAYLDLKIVLGKPDVYSIGFSTSKSTPTSLTLRLRSLPDLQDWEVMEVDGKPEFKDELASYLVNTKDILGVMCRARKRLLSTTSKLNIEIPGF